MVLWRLQVGADFMWDEWARQGAATIDIWHLIEIQCNSISAKRNYPLGGAASPVRWPKAAHPENRRG